MFFKQNTLTEFLYLLLSKLSLFKFVNKIKLLQSSLIQQIYFYMYSFNNATELVLLTDSLHQK